MNFPKAEQQEGQEMSLWYVIKGILSKSICKISNSWVFPPWAIVFHFLKIVWNITPVKNMPIYQDLKIPYLYGMKTCIYILHIYSQNYCLWNISIYTLYYFLHLCICRTFFPRIKEKL